MPRNAVVDQVKKGLSSLFTREAPTDSPPAIARPKLKAVVPPDRGDFMTHLREIVAANTGPVQAGRINFIGLEQAKERLGDRWERLAERAHAVARSAIERHLQPGDIFLAQEDKYVIAFANVDAAEAQVRCRLIASIIERTLFGENGGGELSVATAVAIIDGTVALQELPSLDAMLAWQSVPHENVHVSDTRHPRLRPQATSGTDPIRILWRPIWAAQLGLVAIHHAQAMGSRFNPGDDDGDDTAFDHDERLRDAAVAVLEESLALGRSLIVGLPVQFETMASRNKRQIYLRGLANALSERGKNQLLLTLCDVPTGIHSSRLQEIAAALREQCRALAVRFPPDVADFSAATASGIKWIGLDLPEHLSETTLFGALEHFGRMADRAGIPNRYAGNVRSLSLAAAALKAGFTHLSGPVVGADSDTPKDVRSFDLKTLYMSRLAKA